MKDTLFSECCSQQELAVVLLVEATAPARVKGGAKRETERAE